MKYYLIGVGLSMQFFGLMWSFNHVSAPATIVAAAILIPLNIKFIINQTKTKQKQ